MSASTPLLRAATPADLPTVLSWSTDADSLRRWSGPDTRWPATPETFWADVSHEDTHCFAFTSEHGELIGFGQVRRRQPQMGHLARVVVGPQ
jgi:RimJ/RimL family protein N-acetyltransferase